MSELIVYTYREEDKAAQVLKEIASQRQENVQKPLIGIEDAVTVKNHDGKVRVNQTLETAIKGGNIASGGLWGVLIGFLFGGPLLGALLGMGIGALFGQRIDIGIDNDFIDKIGDSLRQGDSALFLLVKDTPIETVAEELSKHGGTLHHTSLSPEAEEAFLRVSEQDDVRLAMERESSLLSSNEPSL